MAITEQQARELRDSLNDLLALYLADDPQRATSMAVRRAYALLLSTPGPITAAFSRMGIPAP